MAWLARLAHTAGSAFLAAPSQLPPLKKTVFACLFSALDLWCARRHADHRVAIDLERHQVLANQ
jgi:hypothetical protein